MLWHPANLPIHSLSSVPMPPHRATSCARFYRAPWPCVPSRDPIMPYWAICCPRVSPDYLAAFAAIRTPTACKSIGPAASRRKLKIPIASACCSARSTCTCSPRAIIGSLRNASVRRWNTMKVWPACGSRCGRQMRNGFPWSVISTPGTGGATPCAGAARPVYGNCSSLVYKPANATNSK